MDQFEIADNCRDGGTYIGKDGKRHSYERILSEQNPPGTGGCLRAIAVPAMGVSLAMLAVKAVRR
jgi:hypothetical protein